MCFQTIRIQPYTKSRISSYSGRDMNKALNFNKEAYEYNSSDPVILDNLGYTITKSVTLKSRGNISKAYRS